MSNGHVHTADPWAPPKRVRSSDNQPRVTQGTLYVFGLLAIVEVGDRLSIVFLDLTDMHGRYRTQPKRKP